MKRYDVVVVGSGSGMLIADEALSQGLRVAVVDKGPVGGTCLNLGCIPSKTLIFTADRIAEIEEAKKLGVVAEIKSIDFASIMERMRSSREESREHLEHGIHDVENLDFYQGEGHFVADRTIEVNGEKMKGARVFIASGSRPMIPPIKGVDTIDYLTNESALELTERPQSLVIIGGGYIAVEFGHFFAAMGTRVTVVEMLERIAQSEEPEISDLLEQELKKRMGVYTSTQVSEMRSDGKGCVVVARDKSTGKDVEFSAERVMIAVGRRSNADVLKVENTGVEVDRRGFVKVDEYLETSKRNIFAVGDANGQQMFLHVANREAAVAWYNSIHRQKARRVKMDYSAVPHAVYSHPQIASVGLKEEEARRDYHHILVGRMRYRDTAKGEAMMEEEGFAKAIIDGHSGAMLGFHIVGPYAPMLIQEVTNALASGGDPHGIERGMHIHPALSELIPRTLGSVEEVD
jgi:mycothione reductase